MKSFIAVAALVVIIGCSSSSAVVAVVSLGIAGAGLNAYCLADGGGCSPQLLAYAGLINNEAAKDASVLESGQATGTQIQEMLVNLNVDIAQGNGLQGLAASERQRVQGIVSAATVVVSLIQILAPQAPVVASDTPRVTRPVMLPSLSSGDHAKLATMRQKIAASYLKAGK